jgi:tRNA-splicing ligase RtcB
MAQLERELSSIYHQGSEAGDARFAPENLLPDHRDVIRDESLATVGGGNHFVEIQVVDEILDRHEAFRLGIRAGQMAVMVHSGSRAVGQYVGREWMDRARALWPKDQKHPETGIFALHGDEARKYLRAMNTAANYAYVNRLLIGELVRLRLREIFGQVEAPLVYDVPHNIIFEENGLNVHRKGATPAHEGQLLLIPGSMGHSSFLLKGFGAARFLSSASHGAGRAVTRFDMGRKRIDEATLGLTGVECITLREERRIEEAPAAYKPIGPVVDTQINAGILSGVARLRPLLTFKA